MNTDFRMVGAVEIRLEKPTDVTFSELINWVLWQYPRRHQGWLCGAAHPPEPQHGWIPARVQPQNRRVILYAHCAEPLATPEAAADWIAAYEEL